jgi:hypothetical protein
MVLGQRIPARSGVQRGETRRGALSPFGPASPKDANSTSGASSSRITVFYFSGLPETLLSDLPQTILEYLKLEYLAFGMEAEVVAGSVHQILPDTQIPFSSDDGFMAK